jgi:energy-coupling factor transporter ATP-binding protein EcfA2
MGPLVFSKDRVVNSIGADDQQERFRKRLWSGLNLLVIGPPGCGKLSFVSVLGRALHPGIQLTLFDLEAEPEIQTLTVEHFAAQFRRSRERGKRSEGLILRHLHRLSPSMLRRFLGVCSDEGEWDGDSQEFSLPALYATCHESTNWDKRLRSDFERVFPCQIHLGGPPTLRKDVRRFVLDVLGELNERHGTRITEVESGVLDAVQRQAGWRSSLHELRNIVERAYFREDTKRLSARSIEVG